MRTLLSLESMGKLDAFSEVFNLNIYKRNSYKGKLKFLAQYGKEGFSTDNIDYARKNGLKLPSWVEVKLFQIARFIKRVSKKILKNQ